MKWNIKRRLTESDILSIIVNLIPIAGVWFYDWNPKQVFLVYCLESVIIGGYNVIKMLMASIAGYDNNDLFGFSKMRIAGALFLIIFFVVHYGFFVFVQMNIFFGVANFRNIPDGPSGFLYFLTHLSNFLPPDLVWLLVGLVISYGFMTLKNFVLNGQFRKASLLVLMFTPYPRIIVQQFTVIVGSMFLLFGVDKVFIVIFVAVKIFIENFIDYEKSLQEAVEESIAKSNSLQQRDTFIK